MPRKHSLPIVPALNFALVSAYPFAFVVGTCHPAGEKTRIALDKICAYITTQQQPRLGGGFAEGL
jgi:hypothetical protein